MGRAAFAALGLGLLLVATAAAAPLRTRLVTSTPSPLVDQPWRFTVTAKTAAGAPLAARVKLQLLLGTTVAGCWKAGAMARCFAPSAGEWIAFRGRHTGILRFPAESVGVRLTFQALVRARGRTSRLRAPVTVRAGP